MDTLKKLFIAFLFCLLIAYQPSNIQFPNDIKKEGLPSVENKVGSMELYRFELSENKYFLIKLIKKSNKIEGIDYIKYVSSNKEKILKDINNFTLDIDIDKNNNNNVIPLKHEQYSLNEEVLEFYDYIIKNSGEEITIFLKTSITNSNGDISFGNKDLTFVLRSQRR